MKFYLGTHRPKWLRTLKDTPLFVSHRILKNYKTLKPATVDWCLDSGGFTELSLFNEWQTTPKEYITAVRRYKNEIGRLQWASPQDMMCEPFMTEKTGLTVKHHQTKTIENYLELKHLANDLPFIPVLQGWTLDDYLQCVEMYDKAGINLEEYDTVGLGSVCRRQATGEAETIVYRLQPIKLHGFGMKQTALQRFGNLLTSADSMAWSYNGRKRPSPQCDKKTCANCLHYALEWRNKTLNPQEPTIYGVC